MAENISKILREHAPRSGIGMNDPVMSIGAGAKLTGLSESALRKYENAGLIIYHRTETNRRMLSMEDLERIRMIQNLVKNRGLNLEGIKRLWTLIPCWELKVCSAADQEDCQAMSDSTMPCWMLMKNKGCAGETDCRTCEVYRFGAYCTEDIKVMMRELLRRNPAGKVKKSNNTP